MNTWLTATITSLALAGFGCAFSSNSVDTSASSCLGSDCGNVASIGGSPNASAPTSLVVNSAGDAGTPWSPLCGPVNAGCIPDPDAGPCSDVSAGALSMEGGVDGGVDGGADVGTNRSILTCRILLAMANSHNIERACVAAGTGKSGDPCRATSDCGSGLTCVAEDLAGLCRAYCCTDPESCPSNSYCATRSTLISHDPWVLGADVPVCSVAENCPLSDAYPCPQGKNCSCPSGKACMVVRRGGLTACVKPGSGMQGDYCPCAAGFVCSNTTFTCLKLCPLSSSNVPNGQAAADSLCATGTSCQASNDVPPDWGVCSDKPMLLD